MISSTNQTLATRLLKMSKAILLCFLLRTVVVAASSVDKNNKLLTSNSLRGGSIPADLKTRRKLQTKKRFFARYSGSSGRESVRRCAKTILEDDEDTDYTVFEVDFEFEIEVDTNHKMNMDRFHPMEYLSSKNDMNFDISENDDDMDGCLSSLRKMSEILDIEEDRPIELFEQQVLPSSIEAFSSEVDRNAASWGIEAIQADRVPPGPYKVTVCVVDTGIAFNHPGFPWSASGRTTETDGSQTRISGQDFFGFGVGSGQMEWDLDLNGHGTHVAGIVLDVVNGKRNGYRLDEGITKYNTTSGDIDLFIVNAFGGRQKGYESDVLRAVRTCVGEAKADIINLSLGNSNQSKFVSGLYTSIVEDYGAIMVAAAGNNKDASSGQYHDFFPASIPSVISVGAIEEGGERYENSVQNDQVEISAPGQNIVSAGVRWNSERSEMEYVYERRSGTSSAAPHVTGAVTLLKSHFPRCTNKQIRYAITMTATKSTNVDSTKSTQLGLLGYLTEDFGNYGEKDCDAALGYGIIQVRDALEWLLFQEECESWDVEMLSEGGCTTLKGGIVRVQQQEQEETTEKPGTTAPTDIGKSKSEDRTPIPSAGSESDNEASDDETKNPVEEDSSDKDTEAPVEDESSDSKTQAPIEKESQEQSSSKPAPDEPLVGITEAPVQENSVIDTDLEEESTPESVNDKPAFNLRGWIFDTP